MSSGTDIIQELTGLNGVSTAEGKAYRFEPSQFGEATKSGANGFILKAFDVDDMSKEVAIKFYFPRDPSLSENEEDDQIAFCEFVDQNMTSDRFVK
jgi:hypothetical protein